MKNLKNVQFLFGVLALICAAGMIAINLYLGSDYSWPSITFIWILLSLSQQATIIRLEEKLNSKSNTGR